MVLDSLRSYFPALLFPCCLNTPQATFSSIFLSNFTHVEASQLKQHYGLLSKFLTLKVRALHTREPLAVNFCPSGEMKLSPLWTFYTDFLAHSGGNEVG